MKFLFGKFNYSSKTRFVNVPAIGEEKRTGAVSRTGLSPARGGCPQDF
jgi:hypothetical protein